MRSCRATWATGIESRHFQLWSIRLWWVAKSFIWSNDWMLYQLSMLSFICIQSININNAPPLKWNFWPPYQNIIYSESRTPWINRLYGKIEIKEAISVWADACFALSSVMYVSSRPIPCTYLYCKCFSLTYGPSEPIYRSPFASLFRCAYRST